MTSLNDFLHMGGYGQYVWSAYGITAIAMLISVVVPLRQHKILRRQLKRQLKRQDKGKPES